MQEYPTLNKILGQAVRSKFTIILDEQILQLKPALKAAGFKVIDIKQGTSDEDIYELAENCAILTKNRIDFKDHAKAFDFDLIDIKNIQFLDNKLDRSNSTVQKVVKALRDSKLAQLKGNFHLTVLNDGSFKLEEILI